MSAPKHTPGPWKFYVNEVHRTDATVFCPDDGSGRVVGICRVDALSDVVGGPDRQEANAALIAAAPELLEFCRRYLACARDDAWREKLEAQANALIARAEGRTK